MDQEIGFVHQMINIVSIAQLVEPVAEARTSKLGFHIRLVCNRLVFRRITLANDHKLNL